MTTSRWFSRVLDAGDPAGKKLLGNRPVTGSIEPFTYVEVPRTARAIYMPAAAWKLDTQTWWRRDIRDGLLQLFDLKIDARKDVTALWCCSEELYVDPVVRVMTGAEALIECSVAWNWISYICQQPVRVQKRGGLATEVREWLSKQRNLRLPVSH